MIGSASPNSAEEASVRDTYNRNRQSSGDPFPLSHTFTTGNPLTVVVHVHNLIHDIMYIAMLINHYVNDTDDNDAVDNDAADEDVNDDYLVYMNFKDVLPSFKFKCTIHLIIF